MNDLLYSTFKWLWKNVNKMIRNKQKSTKFLKLPYFQNQHLGLLDLFLRLTLNNKQLPRIWELYLKY